MYKVIIGTVFGLLLFSNVAMATCSSYPNPLTNGTTADGAQVMANFNCAALTSGATLENVAALGIGMTASNILDITQNQNGLSAIKILNSNGSGGAATGLYFSNGTTGTELYHYGTGYTTSGVYRQDGFAIQAFGTGGLTLTTALGPYPIYFGINSGEVARFGSDGSFLVGTTTNGGWTGSAKTALVSSGGTVLTLQQTAGSSNALSIRVDNTASNPVLFYSTSSLVGSITTNGTSVAYNTTSDARLKNIDVPQHSYRDAIKKLWVGDFRWKNDSKPGFGVLAQKTYSLFPLAVTKPATASGTWMVDYSKLAPLALWGVKDLYKVTGQQDDRVSAIERQMKSLNGELVSLHHANDNQAAQIRAFRAEISTLQRKVRFQTAER